MFFISDAMADAAMQAGQPSLLATFLPLILIFAVMYFLLIRPQIKRQKEHRKLIDSLAKGDEVVTAGGLLGRIVKLHDNFVTIELADGLEVNVQRHAVNAIMPKGTIKDLKESKGK
ncbi:MAG TPA: preprotein translocase subunit YajC [Halothiobacillus sp.]|nr:preprotein translocase subunit YajC [Halothiobacillus sp.]